MRKKEGEVSKEVKDKLREIQRKIEEQRNIYWVIEHLKNNLKNRRYETFERIKEGLKTGIGIF